MDERDADSNAATDDLEKNSDVFVQNLNDVTGLLGDMGEDLRVQAKRLKGAEITSLGGLVEGTIITLGGLAALGTAPNPITLALGGLAVAKGREKLGDSVDLSGPQEKFRLREEAQVEDFAIHKRGIDAKASSILGDQVDPVVMEILKRFPERWPVIVTGIIEKNAELADDFEQALDRISGNLELVPEKARDSLEQYRRSSISFAA